MRDQNARENPPALPRTEVRRKLPRASSSMAMAMAPLPDIAGLQRGV